jgi:hypothetical protein
MFDFLKWTRDTVDPDLPSICSLCLDCGRLGILALFDILLPSARQGTMPSRKRAIKRGVALRLRGTVLPLSYQPCHHGVEHISHKLPRRCDNVDSVEKRINAASLKRLGGGEEPSWMPKSMFPSRNVT